MDRRSFIKSSGIASLGIGLGMNKTFSNSNNNTSNYPIVIATWDVKDATKKAWRINLDIAGDVQYRKVTGAPKLFKGVVYFPVYQPPEKGGNKCQIGEAYICAADDECGNNVSDLLVEAGGIFFTELLNKNLVDEIHLFKSKIIIGKYGKPAIVGKKLSQLNLSLNERKKFKDDIYTNYQVN